MFGIGISELLIILILVVFFLGGKRLPQIGTGLGKMISEFKKSSKGPAAPLPPASNKITQSSSRKRAQPNKSP